MIRLVIAKHILTARAQFISGYRRSSTEGVSNEGRVAESLSVSRHGTTVETGKVYRGKS